MQPFLFKNRKARYFEKSVTAQSSLCAPFWSHKENHYILTHQIAFLCKFSGRCFHYRTKAAEVQVRIAREMQQQAESGRRGIINCIISSVDVSSIWFQPEMARLSTCLCGRGVSASRGRGVQLHHTRAEVAAKVIQGPILALGNGFGWALLQQPGSSLRVKGRLVSHLQSVHWVWSDQQGSVCIQEFDSSWLPLARADLLSVLSQSSV